MTFIDTGSLQLVILCNTTNHIVSLACNLSRLSMRSISEVSLLRVTKYLVLKLDADCQYSERTKIAGCKYLTSTTLKCLYIISRNFPVTFHGCLLRIYYVFKCQAFLLIVLLAYVLPSILACQINNLRMWPTIYILYKLTTSQLE